MATLRSRIQALRLSVAGEGKSFVPHQRLGCLLTKQEIRNALQSRNITGLYDLDGVVEKIVPGGVRVFAILVVLNGQEKEILRFIEHDNYQATPLDHRLPYALQDLQNIIPEISTDFYEKQWEFTAPVLTKGVEHRVLSDYTILPFFEDRKVGGGGSGEIFAIKLHEGHQDISLISSNKERDLIRKQFPVSDDGRDVNQERELKNLSLLNQLNHPNILKLLASYTYKGRRNFIFPRAKGGDLENLLGLECPPAAFNEHHVFYCALANLSNAIEKIHNFTSEKNLELRLIGLHNDIKPSNILVDGDSFLLADFGLSVFKGELEGSYTPVGIGTADYVAPECNDYDNGLKKGLVNRSSDIWSFGCILAEILTYMLLGSDGVAKFRKKRAIRVTGYPTVRPFCDNGGKVNPEVLAWLSDLEHLCTPVGRDFIKLIRSILRVVRSERPTARKVTEHLRLIAISELLKSVSSRYESIVNSRVKNTQWLHAFTELLKFQAWKTAYESTYSKPIEQEAPKLDLEETLKLLKAFNLELSLISTTYEVAHSPVFTELQHLNEDVLKLFPKELQAVVRSCLELDLLNDRNYNYNDFSRMPGISTAFNSSLRFLAFTKSMVESADRRSSELESERSKQGKPCLLVKPEMVKFDEIFSNHHLGRKFEEHSGAERKILIESIVYDTHWSGEIMEEMVTRAVDIANLLDQITTEVKRSGLLHCSGYFHSITRHSFALIFDFPSSNPETVPKTLNTIIQESRGKATAPLLGNRFALAYNLCSILLNIHKAALLHKNVSSQNVIFFATDYTSLDHPYLVGFNHSRRNDPTAFSEGPQSSPTTRNYQDPRYAKTKRFQLEFDYYSIGLVLLEIGMWDTVENMSKNTNSLEELRKKLIDKRVPFLGHVVGKLYRDAVSACLAEKFSGSGIESSTEEKIIQFEEQVLIPLSRLAA